MATGMRSPRTFGPPSRTQAILMLHLFVAPTPFEGGCEFPYDGATLSQLLAALIVTISIVSLALAFCLTLVTLAVVLLGIRFDAGTVFPLSPFAIGPGFVATIRRSKSGLDAHDFFVTSAQCRRRGFRFVI